MTSTKKATAGAHGRYRNALVKVQDAQISIPFFSALISFVQTIRYYLLRYVIFGTDQIVKIQQFRTPFLDKYFMLATFCGSEKFYVLLFTFLFLVADATLARMMTVMFTIGIYAGNFLKNILCLPRPPSPPVWTPHVCDDTLDVRDYGWPSSHSLNAVAIPFFVLRYYYGFIWVWDYPNPLQLSLMYLFAFLWSGSIIISRLYLGVHSPADVQGGMIMGALILRVFLSVCDTVDTWIISGPHVPIIIHILCALLLSIHPQTVPASYTFAETTSLLGYFAGVVSGSWTKRIDPIKFVVFPENTFVSCTSLTDVVYMSLFFLWRPIVRFILGLAWMATAYVVSKKVLQNLINSIHSMLGLQKTRTGSFQDLTFSETMVKFFTYSSLGWILTFIAPTSFDLLGIW